MTEQARIRCMGYIARTAIYESLLACIRVNRPAFSGTVPILNTSSRCPARLPIVPNFTSRIIIQPNSAREFRVVASRCLNAREL